MKEKIDKREFLVIMIVMIVGAIIGFTYSYVVYFSQPGYIGSIWSGVLIGALIGGLSSGFELLFVARPESKIRALPFIISLLARVSVHMIFIIVVNLTVQIFFNKNLDISSFIAEQAQRGAATDFIFSFCIMSFFVFLFQMRNFIGGRTLQNLLLGRYSKPRIEEHIFIVIDTVGSTQVAQAIGDKRFHGFLNRLFVLFDLPIHRFGGEVSSYVGDAILAVWPLGHDKQKNARVFEAVREMTNICLQRHDQILEEFGIAPEIHVAIHAGPVAVGETGFRKRQITYLGNALNLTFRLEGVAKTKGLPSYFVVSDELLARCELPEGITVVSIGTRELKGSEKPLDVSALLFDAPKNA